MTSKPIADAPGVVAPPPFIFLGFLALGWGLDQFLIAQGMPTPRLPLDDVVRKGAAVALIVGGLMLEFWASALFQKAGTNVVPYKPAVSLVTDGPYKFTRNPMYLGFAITYLGLAIGLQTSIGLALILPAIVVMNWGVISREERYLENKFGRVYTDYKTRARRWL